MRDIQSIMIISSAIIGALSAITAAMTYLSNHRHRKVDRLHKLRGRYWELMFTKLEESGEPLIALLPHDKKDRNPAHIPSIDRQRLLGFFKEVGILVKDGAISKHHAFYLFSYFAIRCEENEDFWTGGLIKGSIYWKPFHDFAREMRIMEDKIGGRGEATEN